jgi:O-antigen/teichoic acid export membrane protein
MTKQKSFLNSVKWAYMMNWGDKASSALFSVILAGLLGPRDFGVISIAVIYVSFLQLFLDQGFATALIQRKHLEKEHLDAVFWMDVVLSIVLIGVSILLSGWWAAKNHAPQAAVVIPVLSVCILFESLSVVQVSLLRREMNFKSLSIRTNASVVLGGAIGIAMAFRGFGIWSIVGQQLVRDLSALVLLWRLSDWRPRLEFSWRHLKELMGFSIPNFIAQIAGFVDGQAGSIALGLFFGPVAVGLYRVAERVTNSVITMVMASIQGVALPEFARLQDAPDELRRSVVTCFRLSSTITLPALAGLAAVSGPLMATIGPKWVAGSAALKVLSALGMFMIFSFFTGPFMQGLGKIRQMAILEWARVSTGVIAIVVAGFLVRNGSVNVQVMGIALGRFIACACIVAPAYVYILARLSGISLKELTAAIAPSAIASGAVAASVMLVHLSNSLRYGKPAILLVADVVVGGIVGLAVLLGLDLQLRLFVVGLSQRVLRMQPAS